MTYNDALTFLDSLPRFADSGTLAFKPGLVRMRGLLLAMGNPHEQVACVHVAGTNGKGSTASMVAAIGTAAGKRMGLHTSPHLFDFAERMRIDGRPAPHSWLASAIGKFQHDIERIEPSYFEASVALSLLHFATEQVDMAVVEVGLGGRLDATNVLVPSACAVTHIGLDHTELLGDSLEAIAKEKGGIAKPGVPLFSTVEDASAFTVLLETVRTAGSPFENVRETVSVTILNSSQSGFTANIKTPNSHYEELSVGLPGRHQEWNAALAIRLVENVWPDIRQDAVREGLAEVIRYSGLRGRSEHISERPRIIVDVAHNPDGWSAALRIAQPERGGQLYVLVGVMSDKEASALSKLLTEFDATALPVGLPSARAMSKSDLAERLRTAGVHVIDVADVEQGVAHFRAESRNVDVLLVTGSHLTVAELLSHFS